MLTTLCEHRPLLELNFLFRRSRESEVTPIIETREDLEERLNRVRCPKCRWRPRSTDRWACSDCGEPENYFAACGAVWNTFDTGGVCPGCSHRWLWTSCLRCWAWSKHGDWYDID